MNPNNINPAVIAISGLLCRDSAIAISAGQVPDEMAPSLLLEALPNKKSSREKSLHEGDMDDVAIKSVA